MTSKSRIVVGLSGGVDSSVAAYLLKRQGHEVVGLFMKNWEDDDDDEYCSTRQDWLDAAAAADVLGIDLEAVNFSAEYKDRVFAEFLREYSAGRHPTRMSYAMPKSSSRRFWTMRCALARSGSRPATMRAYARPITRGARARSKSPMATTRKRRASTIASSSCAALMKARIKVISCIG